MADCCLVQDAPGSELFTILDMSDVALGMMAAISVEEKGPATSVVSAVVEHLRAWGRQRALALRFNTLGAKRRSSSVDQSIPRHQWVRLRT